MAGRLGAVMTTSMPTLLRRDFSIEPLGPFSWDAATSWFDSWAPVARPRSDIVRLAFALDGSFEPTAVALSADGGTVHGEVAGTGDVRATRRQVARIFSLDIDATSYPEVADRDPAVGGLMVRFPGLRPMLFTSPYECAAWAVISQRISMRQAAALKRRLTSQHGTKLEVAGESVGCFPTPEQLLRIETFPGLTTEKVRRLHGVAEAALAGILDAERLRAMDPADAVALVRQIPGIGPFWGSGIYLRAAGATDVFPEEPRSVAALARLKGLGHPPSGEELEALVEPYRPWRMWVCVLLRVAAGRGALP